MQIGAATLSENDICAAIIAAEKSCDLDIADFAFFVTDAEYLTILLEPRGSFEPTAQDESKIIEALERELCRENISYAAARQNGLPACRISWNQPQTHLLYRDAVRFRKKTAPDQIKSAHFLNRPTE